MHPTTYIIPEWRVIWPLLTTANLPLLSMPVASATGHASLASKRSPTQRHMHNYSLPSPSSSTTPRPTRSQSSHTLSDFRQAVYIPVKVPETKDDSLRGPRASRCDRISRDTTGMETPCTLNISPRSAASIRATASDPSISLFAYFNEEEPLASHTGPVTPSPSAFSPSAYSVRRMITASGSPSPSLSSSTSPPISPTASSPRRLGMSPLSPKDSTTKMNLVSPLSIPSLTFPLPTPPGLSPDYGWDDDPFAAVSSSFADAPRSKWSPTSSSLSLAHVPKSSDNGSKKNESPPEKFKGDTAAPTKLKDFFGRLNINRSPITSGFHFRSWSQSTSNKYGEAQEKRINRPNSLMAFFIVDEEKESTIKNTTFTHSDDTCIFEPPTLYPDSHAFGSGERDFCSEVADALRLGLGDTEWNTCTESPTSVRTVTNSVSSRASKRVDVDGISVNEDASIQTSLPNCFHGSSSYSPSIEVATSLDMPLASDIYSSLAKPHSRQLSIPPPPRSQPPSPPKASPPPFASNAVVSGLDLGFPSPPTLTHYIHPSSTERPKILSIPLSSPSNRQLPHLPTPPEIFPLQVHKPSSAGSGCSDVPAARPPAVPPRSKLRPPPVKITTDFRRTLATASPASDRASPAHSFSSSVESLTISPLASPPLHSQSSSIASSIMSSSPTSPQPSPSPSIASSFVISPMPTPPLLSPTSPVPTSPGSNPPPLAIPRIRPVTPEPQIDMGLLRTLLMQRKRSESYDECESEVGESLEASVAESDTAESSTCITTVPEFAWQEEPRSPPSRMSFCESLERNNPSSDIEDDDAVSIYSQFSAAYTFRSRSIRGRNGRLSRRTTAVSMMSVYSQASISPQDAMDLPPIPVLPWDLKGDLFPEETVADSDLGEMTFNAPEYAYAYSLDDYVGHGLEGAALAGRTASRSGADFEAELPTSHMKTPESSNRSASDDWRAFLTAKVDVKRRTSSNISVVGVVPPVQDPEVTTGLTFTNRGSKTTNRGIGGVSTASHLTPRSPRTLAPNRRQKTIRRATSRPPSLPRSNCRPASPRYVVEAGTGAGDWRPETSSADSVPFSSLGLADRTKKPHGMRSGLRDVRSRVSGLKSRLVSLTISSPRSSPSSPSFTPAPSPNFYHHRPGHAPSPPSPLNRPPASSPWPVSPSVSSYSASGKSDVSLPRGPSDSSWNLGRTHGDGLSFSPTATPSTFPMAI